MHRAAEMQGVRRNKRRTARPRLHRRTDVCMEQRRLHMLRNVCTRDESHTMDGGAATVTHETTTPATCTTAGVETYTATATVNGTTYMWSEKLTREIPTTNHQFPYGSLECSVCGTSALQAGEFHGVGPASGVELGHTGMKVTVAAYAHGELTYMIKYQPSDDQSSSDQGHIALVVKSGDEIKVIPANYKSGDDYAGTLTAGEARTHKVTFNIGENDEPLFIEYSMGSLNTSNFWNEEKHDNSLYWKA